MKSIGTANQKNKKENVKEYRGQSKQETITLDSLITKQTLGKVLNAIHKKKDGILKYGHCF